MSGEACHYCKHEFVQRERPVLARFRHETYGGEEFFIYITMCGNCARSINHGAEILNEDALPPLEQQTWRQGRLRDSPPAPAVKGPQMTIDEAGQLKLFEEER